MPLVLNDNPRVQLIERARRDIDARIQAASDGQFNSDLGQLGQ